MDQKTMSKVPVIKFNEENLKPGTPSWSSTSDDVRRALEEYGCFVLVSDIIPLELRDEMFRATDRLFDLPVEIKVRNINKDVPMTGYFGQTPYLQNFEGMIIERATNLQKMQRFGDLMWPNGDDHKFCETAHKYTNMLSHLDKLLTKMICESYGIDTQKCENHIDSTAYGLRMNKYRVLRDGESDVGLTEHTDKILLAIFAQNQISGLEIRTKDGHWIPFHFLPSSFSVIAGEAMTGWSNGRVHSPIHRVIMGGKETRYSLGSSSYHKGIIYQPEEFIDEEHPRCFKPFNHLDFQKLYAYKALVQSGGAGVTNLIQEFCGV